MQTSLALLRGVNVGGKTCKMDALRAVFEKLGASDVRTYVQSGNVVFGVPPGSAARLASTIEARLLGEFGFPIRVLVKTLKEMEQIAQRNPFVKEKAIDQSKLHVTFLSGIPAPKALPELQKLLTPGEQFRVWEKQVYLYCPNGYGRTKISNNAI